MLKDYLDDRGPKPDPTCVLVLGQERPFCRDDTAVLVSVTIASSRALEDLKKAEAAVSHAHMSRNLDVGLGAPFSSFRQWRHAVA